MVADKLTTSGAMRAIFHPRRVLVAILAMGLFVMAARHVTDPDVWWHLRTGELILQSHHVPHTDPFSFTRLGQPWVDHEWLSQVLMYGLFRVASWTGLILFFAAVVAASYLLVFFRCPERSYLAAVLTLWGAAASAPSWGVRPQVLSLLLGSLFLFLLERSQRRPQILWWTVPLTLLWVNLHAGYALGIGLFLLFIGGGLLDVALGAEAWTSVKPRLSKLVAATLLCLAVVPLNPNGARLYSYPLQTLRSHAMQTYIQEWMSANFHLHRFLPLLAMVLALHVLLPLSSRQLRPRELLLPLATFTGALISVRHIPIFALVAVPILDGLVAEWLGGSRLGEWLQRSGGHGQTRTTANALILTALLIFVLVRIGYVAERQTTTESREFPVGAVAFLASHKPQPHLINNYGWGGYLIWKLYPQVQVFIDGRADVFGDTMMDQNNAAYYLNSDWQAVLQQWDIRTVLAAPDAPLTSAIRLLPGWKQVYGDSQAVIMSREP